jgi:hypothetical protein
MLLVTLAVWLTGALPMSAQVDLGEYHVLDTRFGQIQVIGGEADQQLWYAGEFLPLPVEPLYWIRGAFGMEGEDHDWVIVSSNHRGNMCGGYGQWFLIRASAEGVVVAPPLDACMGILDVRVLPGRVEVDLSHRDLGIARETFTFDGTTLTSVLVPEEVVAPAGPGGDVTRWIGRPTHEMFRDASERARLGTIMSPDQVQFLSTAMSFGAQIEERDGWVLAHSCQQHNCGFSQGVWAVRIEDGAAAAALLQGDQLQVQGFGLVDDPVVAAFIAEVRS